MNCQRYPTITCLVLPHHHTYMHSSVNNNAPVCGVGAGEPDELHTRKKLSSLIEAVENFSLQNNSRIDPDKPVLIAANKIKKGVKFAPLEAEIVASVPTRESLSEDEKRETWWSSTEYQGIRLGAKFITKDIRKRDKDLIAGIEEAYARALHLACTLSDDDYEDLMQNCSSQANCMRGWCDRSISPRGLERYTSHKHRFERTEFAEETRAAVLRLSGNESVTAEQLSVFYKEYARSAAIYARFCGEADFLVVMSDRPPPPAATAARDRAGSSAAVSNGVVSSSSRSGSSPPKPSLSSSSRPPPPTHQASFDRRELLRRSKEPSQGRLMVRQLSSRIERIETVA